MCCAPPAPRSQCPGPSFARTDEQPTERGYHIRLFAVLLGAESAERTHTQASGTPHARQACMQASARSARLLHRVRDVVEQERPQPRIRLLHPALSIASAAASAAPAAGAAAAAAYVERSVAVLWTQSVHQTVPVEALRREVPNGRMHAILDLHTHTRARSARGTGAEKAMATHREHERLDAGGLKAAHQAALVSASRCRLAYTAMSRSNSAHVWRSHLRDDGGPELLDIAELRSTRVEPAGGTDRRVTDQQAHFAVVLQGDQRGDLHTLSRLIDQHLCAYHHESTHEGAPRPRRNLVEEESLEVVLPASRERAAHDPRALENVEPLRRLRALRTRPRLFKRLLKLGALDIQIRLQSPDTDGQGEAW